MNEGIIEDSFNQKQDFRMKQLENYQKENKIILQKMIIMTQAATIPVPMD